MEWKPAERERERETGRKEERGGNDNCRGLSGVTQDGSLCSDMCTGLPS